MREIFWLLVCIVGMSIGLRNAHLAYFDGKKDMLDELCADGWVGPLALKTYGIIRDSEQGGSCLHACDRTNAEIMAKERHDVRSK